MTNTVVYFVFCLFLFNCLFTLRIRNLQEVNFVKKQLLVGS